MMKAPSYAWTTITVKERLAMGYSYRLASDALIVMLHGLGCSRLTYQDAWLRPELATYSLMCLDFSGFGQTSPPEHGALDCEFHAQTLAATLKAFLARFPHERVYLVGHSMGASVALLLDEAVQSLLQCFIFVEGNLVAEDCFFSREIVGMGSDAFGKSMPDGIDLLIGEGEEHFFLETSKPKALFQTAASLVAMTEDGTFLDKYRGLSLPHTYVHGQESQVPAFVKGCAIQHSGHFPMNQNPVAFYTTIARYISQI